MLEDPSFTSIGIVGVFALLLVREVFSFLEGQKLKENGSKAAWLIESAKAMTQLENEMKKLNHSINNLTQVLTGLTQEARMTRAEVQECRKDIEEMKGQL